MSDGVGLAGSLGYALAVLVLVLRTAVYTVGFALVSYLFLSPAVDFDTLAVTATDPVDAILLLLGVLFALGGVVVLFGGALEVVVRVIADGVTKAVRYYRSR